MRAGQLPPRSRVAAAPLNQAVVTAIAKVNEQADDEPDNQPHPVPDAQLVHHVTVEEDAEYGHNGNGPDERARERAVRGPDQCGAAP